MDRFIKDIKKYYKYMLYAAKAELKSEVAGSHLGWLWWFLEPLCFMLVYAFMVIAVFNASEKYMLAFVFIGNTIWTFFNKSVTSSVKLISNNKNIVTKVYIPKFILVLVKMLVNFFKLLVSLLIVAGIMLVYQVPLSVTMFQMIPVLVLLFLLTFGLCVIFSHFGVFVEDLANVVNILLKLLFYLSGIFYSVSTRVPAPYGGILTRINPVAYAIEQSRGSLLYSTGLDWLTLGVWFVIAIVLCIIGIKTVYKNENNYVKVMS